MAETRKHVSMVEVDRTCDRCGVGKMRPTGMAMTSCPPQYPHACDGCGHEDIYRVTYPYAEIRQSGDRFDSWGDEDEEEAD